MWSPQAVRDSKLSTVNAIYAPWVDPEAHNSVVGWHWNTYTHTHTHTHAVYATILRTGNNRN